MRFDKGVGDSGGYLYLVLRPFLMVEIVVIIVVAFACLFISLHFSLSGFCFLSCLSPWFPVALPPPHHRMLSSPTSPVCLCNCCI
jgi:hypothetical protein